jgi:hypothetical protein
MTCPDSVGVYGIDELVAINISVDDARKHT